MEYARLGRTDLVVPRVALGTAPLGGLFGAVDAAAAAAVVDEALALGVTLVDTSASYGDAEERLGRILRGRRHEALLATKAGRFGDAYDFSPAAVRRSLEASLRRLGTDHVDVFQLHNVEHADLDRVLDETVPELHRLRREGLCRYVGMTGYPEATLVRVVREAEVDVALTYARATLLDDSVHERVLPAAAERGVGLLNASAVALGLLTARGPARVDGHPATPEIRAAARRMAALCAERGVDVSFVANQYSAQRSGCVTTVVGTGRVEHLRSAVRAAGTPLDEELLGDLLALRPPPGRRAWSGEPGEADD